MKKILIVDDEKIFLKSFSEGLSVHGKKNGFKVLTAENGRIAIDVLSKENIDLLITDLRMPEVDGFKLIAYISGKFQNLPVIVMTAFGSTEISTKIRNAGILNYVEKPIDFEDMLKIILTQLKAKRRGRVQGMNLSTFIQIIWMDKMTCTLTLKTENQTGFLYIKSGEVIHAETKDLKGIDAAYEIVTWENVTIEIIDVCEEEEKTIDLSMENLLLEAFRKKDEKTRDDEILFDIEDDFLNKILKEVPMDIQKLNDAVEVLKENLGQGLISTDIFTTMDAQSIVGWNSNPTACALFTQITSMLNTTLKESGFPQLAKYFLLDLVDNKIALIIPMKEFIWIMLLDSTKSPLGLLLNIIMPKAIQAFNEALQG